MDNTLKTTVFSTEVDEAIVLPDNAVSIPESDVIHVGLIETLPAYTSALSLADNTAIPNVKWDALLTKLQDDNGMINITKFETHLEVLTDAGMRPPKSSGVGTSNRSDLENKCAVEVNAIFKVYKPGLKAINKMPLLYFRSIEVKSDDTVDVSATVEGADSEE